VLREGGEDRSMEDTAITAATTLVVALVALTYALMIWANAHRS
jgi:hypothetical protein